MALALALALLAGAGPGDLGRSAPPAPPESAAAAAGPESGGASPGDADPPVESERLFLSGTGPEHPLHWEFRIDSGRGAGRWGVIAVPSNWELEGWGRYTHGKQWWRPAERAVYRTQFLAPARFRQRRVELVFGGVMTDAEVWLNGRPLGEPHRGGYTRFAFDVSTRLSFDLPNRLEVHVAEASADPSVNRAEREADYWVFGGIYRPVYLEAHPRSAILHAAVDARHDGWLEIEVESDGPLAAGLRAWIETLEGEPVGGPLAATGAAGGLRVEGRVEGVEPWSAESPRLYRLWLELLAADGAVLHRRGLRIGFRTVELRAGRGLFVNGRRTVLRGVNRHSHWPESGRAVPAAVNRRDVELIRSLNMNAVRTAHSPPDPDFLDACDELGVYVVDELPGWHDAYDTRVGSRLLREMVRRDLNHPSVILWANGNEGGWNRELDPLFGELDPQGRPVIHPGARALGFEASHYPDWDELRRLVTERGEAAGDPPPVLLPTEMLHALYDGGGGASLADYWRLLRTSERLGGAFLWSLFDEGVVRTDRGGRIDTSGNRGADGLLGPYRQPEASAGAVRDIWSPVQLSGRWRAPEPVEIALENRFDETDLSACTLRWRWLVLPALPGAGPVVESAAGGEQRLPPAAPGETASLRLEPPEGSAADAVELRVFAPGGRELTARVVPNETVDRIAAAWRPAAGSDGAEVRQERRGSQLTLRSAGGRWARFDLDSGSLVELGDAERRLPLVGGARRADGRRARLAEVEVLARPRAVEVRAGYRGSLDELRWLFDGRGYLRLDYAFHGGGGDDADYLGVSFDGLEGLVRSLTWLGIGPYRVWRNRLAGGRLGLWRTEWNDSVTGVDWLYPELPGFYAGVRWASLATDEGTLNLAPDRRLFLGVLEPRFPADARTAVAEVPAGISLLHQISAVGTKFHPPQELGPAARRRLPAGRHGGGVWLRFDGAGRARP